MTTSTPKDRISEIINEITDAALNDRPKYKELLANQETFRRMHKAYEELFNRQAEFPIFGPVVNSR
jgi:hypothetical protein